MQLPETLAFYLLVGAAVSVAVYLDDRPRAGRAWMTALAVVFWPLFLPLLLTGREHTGAADGSRLSAGEGADAMHRAIAQVGAELDEALATVTGWPDDVLARETARIQELRAALLAQAARIREMDALLSAAQSAGDSVPLAGEMPDQEFAGAAPECESFAREPHDAKSFVDSLPTSREVAESVAPGPSSRGPAAAHAAAAAAHPHLAPREESLRGRARNLARLSGVRSRAYADLMATLAWIRELVSMIHLARFTHAPATRTQELVLQISSAIETLTGNSGAE